MDHDRLATELQYILDCVLIFRSTNGWARFHTQVERTISLLTETGKATQVLSNLAKSDRSRSDAESFASPASSATLVLRGTVNSVLDKFGFIDHPKYPQRIFFHRGSLARGLSLKDLVVGGEAGFELEAQTDGRYRGLYVSPL